MSADGYQQFTYGSVLYPDDIYDFESITVANPGSAGPDDTVSYTHLTLPTILLV